MKAVEEHGRLWQPSHTEKAGTGVQLDEWEKEGWTYHAKGTFDSRVLNGALFIPCPYQDYGSRLLRHLRQLCRSLARQTSTLVLLT